MIMKKIISTLLSLVLVIGMLPIMASADEVTPAWDGTAAESFAGGAVTLDVNKAIDGAKVYVAAYDGTTGRLISADVADVATTVPVNVTTTGATIVKVFVWDADLTPLADAISKPL